MIQKEDIYARTNDGLLILKYYYPFLDESFARPGKKFKLRDESDASASMRLHKGCYRITDFGDDSREYTPLDIVMREERITFAEACALMAQRFGIYDESFKGDNARKSIKTVRPATADEAEGYFSYETRELGLRDAQLFGTGISVDHMKEMGWMALSSYTVVRNREAITRESTDTFPIYARCCYYTNSTGEEDFFLKLYQPLNSKQYRFSYYPAGKKPQNYVNGLRELQKKYQELNKSESEEENTQKGGGKRVDYACICSGERDAMCAYARGLNPIWFNSETGQIRDEDVRSLKLYAKNILNIPDIDETGRRQGAALALRFLDLNTIWLPAAMQKYKDWRGNPYKDFRDWCELHPSTSDFTNLLNMSLQAQFWTMKRTKQGDWIYDIDIEYFHYFLRLNDFFVFHDEDSGQYFYMHQEGNYVERVTTREIKSFLRDWARERCLSRNVRNLIMSSKLTENIFEALDERNINFKKHTSDSQVYFFENMALKVTADAIERYTGSSVLCMKERRIKHNIHIVEPFFKAEKGTELWNFEVLSTKSKYFCYLINSSRIYWRKELEEYADKLNEDERALFLQQQKFAITSPALTAAENYEQVQCLLSKLFTIGYYLHGFKTPSRAWAANAMDWKLGERDENNGRSGKSFYFKFADIFLNIVRLSGRNKELLKNNHVYERVDKFTDIVLIDDCNVNMTPDNFFDNITSDLTVNPKNQTSYSIPFEESAKFAFTTNFVPLRFDPSSHGRLLYLVFSDYYHVKTSENDYRENREIFNDFGKTLYTDYNEEEYNEDINFFCQCLQFYLQCCRTNMKLQPDLTNIIKRSLKANMSESFEDWAQGYFALEGNNCNRFIDKQEVFYACKNETGQPNLTSQRFIKQLKSFIELSPFHKQLNPVEFCGRSGRIIRTQNGISREQLYIQTINDATS